ncbi:unnamed protein product [Rhizophagus irregularis]|nr:unnamed protein product [Rhizophagus irregularis]CAB4446823.1 unnamed protein product [Rhizophagus irregularis]
MLRNRKQVSIGFYRESPLTSNTEVSCDGDENKWNFKHSKLENHQGFLRSNDIINLSIKKKDDTFQEVCCYERLGGNDEWCIKLIKQYNLTLDQIC